MNRFDALSLSLAELALNVLFALLFLLGVQSVVLRSAAPPAAAAEELERATDDLEARLEAALESEARLQREIEQAYGAKAGAGPSTPRSNCPDELFSGTVVSATGLRIGDEVLSIPELGRRFPGTDRRIKSGCVHKVRIRFAPMDGRSYERALRALENRYRVYREDS